MDEENSLAEENIKEEEGDVGGKEDEESSLAEENIKEEEGVVGGKENEENALAEENIKEEEGACGGKEDEEYSLAEENIKEEEGAVGGEENKENALAEENIKEEEGAVGGIEVKHEEKKENILYKELLDMHQQNVAYYNDEFDCPICLEHIDNDILQGIILKECLHIFCRTCLVTHIMSSQTVDVPCPYQDVEYSCESKILEIEIQEILTEDQYDKRLNKTLEYAKVKMSNAVHCKLPDCPGWIINEGINEFHCPSCRNINCIPCKAIHDGLTCAQFNNPIFKDGPGSIDEKKSEAVIQELLNSAIAMHCPECGAVVEKISGCDGVTCTVCKTQLCWATKMRRWGPQGQGDTSGGCRCGVSGRKCHPSCSNCH